MERPGFAGLTIWGRPLFPATAEFSDLEIYRVGQGEQGWLGAGVLGAVEGLVRGIEDGLPLGVGEHELGAVAVDFFEVLQGAFQSEPGVGGLIRAEGNRGLKQFLAQIGDSSASAEQFSQGMKKSSPGLGRPRKRTRIK